MAVGGHHLCRHALRYTRLDRLMAAWRAPVIIEQSLFDGDNAAVARDDAVVRVDAAADDGWRSAADAAIRITARLHDTFIVDEVWQTGLPETRENRALGARMLAAVKAGVIAPTDEYRPSARVTSHKVPRRVWRSLISAHPPTEGP